MADKILMFKTAKNRSHPATPTDLLHKKNSSILKWVCIRSWNVAYLIKYWFIHV